MTLLSLVAQSIQFLSNKFKKIILSIVSKIFHLATVWAHTQSGGTRLCLLTYNNTLFSYLRLKNCMTRLKINFNWPYLLVPWCRTFPPVRLRSPAHPLLNFLKSRLHLTSAIVRHLPTSTSVKVTTTTIQILQFSFIVMNY